MGYPRVNYEMSADDLNELLDRCKPTPVMRIGGYSGSSPQENANRAWAALGQKMGFDSMTVQPIPGKGHQFFSAVPTENEAQRTERLAAEKEAALKKTIETLEAEIAERQARLTALLTPQQIAAKP